MFLVTGATGSLGRRVVHALREREAPVRAFVRLSSRYGDLLERGADIFVGDLRHERDIERSLRGIRYVISTHGAGQDATTLMYRANLELIDRAQAQGVEHFTFISVLGAERGYEDAPTFKAKQAVESYLKQSGLTYTILRPSGFANNLLPLAERCRNTGIYLLIGDPTNRSSIVSTDDLARIAAESAGNEAARQQTLAVGGPEILERRDIPKILGKIFQREPFVLNIPLPLWDGARELWGWFEPDAARRLGTLRTLLANEFYCTPEQVAQVESIYGFKMESLESFFRRYLG